MDRKPWKSEGSHRAPFGGEGRSESSDRRPRFNADRRSDRGDRPEFSDRRSDRRDFSDRREFGDRRGDRSDRREFGDRRGGDRTRGPRKEFGDRRERFGVRSGPRARALETRRFSDRSDFARQGVVRLDWDVASYFESAEAVNAALRSLIQAAQQVKFPQPAKEESAPEAVNTDVVETEETEVVTDPFEDEEFQEDESEVTESTPEVETDRVQ